MVSIYLYILKEEFISFYLFLFFIKSNLFQNKILFDSKFN
jgi:hypothetical protein